MRADEALLYTHGPEGYSDYPARSPAGAELACAV